VIGNAQTTQAPETGVGLVTDDATFDTDGVLVYANMVDIRIGTVQVTPTKPISIAAGQYDLRGKGSHLDPARALIENE